MGGGVNDGGVNEGGVRAAGETASAAGGAVGAEVIDLDAEMPEILPESESLPESPPDVIAGSGYSGVTAGSGYIGVAGDRQPLSGYTDVTGRPSLAARATAGPPQLAAFPAKPPPAFPAKPSPANAFAALMHRPPAKRERAAVPAKSSATPQSSNRYMYWH